MTANYVSVFNQLRPLTIGFDSAFDLFEQMFRGDLHQTHQQGNYPPYNIVKTGPEKYNIEVALAGYGKDDINVDFAEGLLTIKSIKKIMIYTLNTSLKE